MIIFHVLGFTVLFLLMFIIIILFVPIVYKVSGGFRGEFLGDAAVGAGPFKALVHWGRGEGHLLLTLFGITLKKGELGEKGQKAGPARKKKKRKPAGEKRTTKGWQNFRDFIEKDFIAAILRRVKRFLRHLSPKVLELRGGFGFDCPEYTGALAAINSIFPGIHAEPNFAAQEPNFDILIEGYIVPAVLVYFILEFLAWAIYRFLYKKYRQRKRIRRDYATI